MIVALLKTLLSISGFYRVNYEADNWKLLIKHLNSDKYMDISSVTRAQLIDDSLELARGGRLSYDTALNLTTYLTKERDYVAWQSALNNFEYLDIMLRNTYIYGKFQVFIH